MKKKWLMRLAALCIAVMLGMPVYAEEIAVEAESSATPAPEATVAVEVTDVIPAQTETPAAALDPDQTQMPETTEAPGTDALSEVTDAEETEVPVQTPVSEETPVPEETAEVSEETPAPESTSDTQTTTPVPDAAGEEGSQEATVAPETTPEQTATPEPTAEIPSELTCGEFTLKINDDDTLCLIGWSGEGETVSVPAEAEGKRIVSIAASAFSGNEKLREVILPAGLISIDGGAFSGCSALEEITLSDSLEQAGDIFDDCSALEVVRLNISNEIMMSAVDGYTREIIEIIDEVEQKRTVSVSIGRDITDFCVLDGGHWQVNGAMLVAEEHSAFVSSGGLLTVAEAGSITVLGSLACEGSVDGEGSIVSCSGEVSGVENVVRDHSWSEGECTVCGRLQTIMLDVEVLRESFERTYDGTSGIDIFAEDFELSGVLEGDEVFIAAVNCDFGKKDAGSYLANISFVLDGEDAGRYAVKQVEIAVEILRKRVTVTPRSGQGKLYGEKDPTLSAGYKGTVKGETLQGALSREKGEAAGKYRILSGSLDRMNPNYEIVLSEAYFEISRKSLSDSDIKTGKVSNQRYSGDAIRPSVEIHDGSALLEEGRDYVLSYTDNVSVGTARIEISGIGNYSGSRTLTFQIIKVSSGSSGSSLSASSETGASLEELNDFASAGTLADENTPVSRKTLTVGERDLGYLLFDAEDEPLSFVQSERMLEENDNLYSILTIEVQELVNEFDIPLEDDYGQVRMRLSMDMVHAAQAAGYTHIELIVGEAEMRIPLDTLYAEFVSVDGTLSVDCYEARLWLMKDEELSEAQKTALEGYALTMQPVHFELLAVPKAVGGESAEAVDVLSLLDGVQLLFVPQTVPDYANTIYSVIRVEQSDSETQHEPTGATFILDGEQVKSSLNPLFGGMYALATK